jgi:putative membrane protein insertion efficiency factor
MMTWLACLTIRIYKLCVSPLLGPCCRYYPSCSDYTIEAIRRFGVARGLALGTGRILRCHPFIDGGLDPVPDRWGRST